MAFIDEGWVMDTAVSYVDGDTRIINRYPHLADKLEEFLLEHNIERCDECGWFVEAGELADENGDLQLCEDCRRH